MNPSSILKSLSSFLVAIPATVVAGGWHMPPAPFDTLTPFGMITLESTGREYFSGTSFIERFDVGLVVRCGASGSVARAVEAELQTLSLAALSIESPGRLVQCLGLGVTTSKSEDTFQGNDIRDVVARYELTIQVN